MNVIFHELDEGVSPQVAAKMDVDVPVVITQSRDDFGNPLLISGFTPELKLITWGKQGRAREDAVTRHWVSEEPITPDVLAALLNAAFRSGEQSARHAFRNKLLKLMEL